MRFERAGAEPVVGESYHGEAGEPVRCELWPWHAWRRRRSIRQLDGRNVVRRGWPIPWDEVGDRRRRQRHPSPASRSSEPRSRPVVPGRAVPAPRGAAGSVAQLDALLENNQLYGIRLEFDLDVHLDVNRSYEGVDQFPPLGG